MMSIPADFLELEVALKTEKSSKVKKLHLLLFFIHLLQLLMIATEKIREFTEFPLKKETAECEDKIREIKDDFLVNEEITICDMLFFDNVSSLSNRIVYNRFA